MVSMIRLLWTAKVNLEKKLRPSPQLPLMIVSFISKYKIMINNSK